MARRNNERSNNERRDNGDSFAECEQGNPLAKTLSSAARGDKPRAMLPYSVPLHAAGTSR